MGLRISIEQVDNGYILTTIDDQVGDAKTTVHNNAGQTIRAIREVFGLKRQGRPVVGGQETKVFDPFEDDA